ncbi:hypothetical protein CLOSTMETH_02668 [[Clostridium] methylpentosum DSM 5476]|uniref:Uncharacterized protein n=1 Tax=[Clostridium] methylpentosum DSM 5476 TaxID=537013 RepID=C0EFM6_9FIRM|nr:hypothetical protein CLOSTMETH_02668 [[Clostridium] methylpentosum DSM 5476]
MDPGGVARLPHLVPPLPAICKMLAAGEKNSCFLDYFMIR